MSSIGEGAFYIMLYYVARMFIEAGRIIVKLFVMAVSTYKRP